LFEGQRLSPIRFEISFLPLGKQNGWTVVRFQISLNTRSHSIDHERITVDQSDRGFRFDFSGIFEAFVKEDYEKAGELAGGFRPDPPRVRATIAIACAIVDKKK
jgi:hypothetical protein